MALNHVVYLLGLITLLHHAFKFIHFFSVHLSRPSTPLARYKHGTESWAFITGASEGIGFGFAQTLRAQGWNLIILSRRAGKLEDAKRTLELEMPGNGEVRMMAFDAMTGSSDELQKLVECIGDLPITLLVNNVGGIPIAAPHFRELSRFQLQEIDDTIAMNARFMARLTALMLPVLKRNGPSLIVNMSSGAQLGIPWLVMYSATKGFVRAFSLALAREMRAEEIPVDVVNLNPGDVRSAQHQVPTGWTVPSSREFAEASVRTLGMAVWHGFMEWSPYWVHGLFVGVLEALPERVRQAALDDEMRRKRRLLDNLKGE